MLYYSFTVTWTVETLNRIVDAELEELPADMRALPLHFTAHTGIWSGTGS
jgi:hypothetical protein